MILQNLTTCSEMIYIYIYYAYLDLQVEVKSAGCAIAQNIIKSCSILVLVLTDWRTAVFVRPVQTLLGPVAVDADVFACVVAPEPCLATWGGSRANLTVTDT